MLFLGTLGRGGGGGGGRGRGATGQTFSLTADIKQNSILYSLFLWKKKISATVNMTRTKLTFYIFFITDELLWCKCTTSTTHDYLTICTECLFTTQIS